jgi:hypothetical protein
VTFWDLFLENSAIDIPDNVSVFHMLLELDAISARVIIGKLRVVKVARHVIAMRLAPIQNNATL